MKPALVSASKVAAVMGIALFLVLVVCSAAGMRINTSRSIPVGVYWTSSSGIAKGSYVVFCPPEKPVMLMARQRGYLVAGYCPGGYGYMMKQVAALAGSLVEVTAHGVSVDGTLLPHSALRERDAEGRRLPRLVPSMFFIDDSEVLLMSDVSATSFDSRYYGPIALGQIESVVVPVVTW